MKFRFGDNVLERLYTERDFRGPFSKEIVKLYRKRMAMIRSAPDERDFYDLKSLHFEKLSGKRKNQRSIRLNEQLRLVIEFEGKGDNKTVVILAIEDYH